MLQANSPKRGKEDRVMYLAKNGLICFHKWSDLRSPSYLLAVTWIRALIVVTEHAFMLLQIFMSAVEKYYYTVDCSIQ